MINDVYKALTTNDAPAEHQGFIILEGTSKMHRKFKEAASIDNEILDAGHVKGEILIGAHNEFKGNNVSYASLHANIDGEHRYFMGSLSEEHPHAHFFASGAIPKEGYMHTIIKGPKHVLESIKSYITREMSKPHK